MTKKAGKIKSIIAKRPYKINLAPTLSAHWYEVIKGKKNLGYFPSSTTILNAYPQSPQLTKWIAEQGWQESQRIKSAAGVRGTNVHSAVEMLLDGQLLTRMNFTLEEWHKIWTFTAWHKEFQPEVIAQEIPVFSEEFGYAGRFDLLALINNELCVVDWKTSSSIHNHFPLQFASYAKALEETYKGIKIENTAAVQLGARNKNGYRFVLYPDWKDHFEVFKSVKNTWEYEHGTAEPPVLNLPEELKL